ncbi:MAG: hypothetical protein F6K39_32260 [Okeania sp. SIO3B3]|nr:hypothetical protein [Okeania sp. SIO3B3]
MAEKGVFRGDLRVGLFDLLATAPPNSNRRKIWMRYFNATNSLDSADIRTLEA